MKHKFKKGDSIICLTKSLLPDIRRIKKVCKNKGYKIGKNYFIPFSQESNWKKI